MAPAIIVFSHIRWDFFYQRPQHLLSRLARYYSIIFIEEPTYDEKNADLKTYSPLKNILVCQPHTPVVMAGFHEGQAPYLHKILNQVVRDYDNYIVWFYTPTALPFLQNLHPRLVVYDCIEELSSFRSASTLSMPYENALLKVADLVFIGAQSKHDPKQISHANTYFFPNSVDVNHFVQALDRTNSHPAHKDIPGPRLGFYGVMDERFDADLIAKVADAHPQWQVVLVGPVVGIDPANLPQRINIHYLGPYSYEALPQFLAGWDVCLMPVVLNESHRLSSSSILLEYMAAELPIVSTLLQDAAAYEDIVTYAADADTFIAACESALLAEHEEIAVKVEKMRQVLACISWDVTVQEMCWLMEDALSRKAVKMRSTEESDETEFRASNNSDGQKSLPPIRTMIMEPATATFSTVSQRGFSNISNPVKAP